MNRTFFFSVFGVPFVGGFYWRIFKPWQFLVTREYKFTVLVTIPFFGFLFGRR